jgi:hypothetical protein
VQCGHVLSSAQERALGYRVTALGALHARAGARTSPQPHRGALRLVETAR